MTKPISKLLDIPIGGLVLAIRNNLVHFMEKLAHNTDPKIVSNHRLNPSLPFNINPKKNIENISLPKNWRVTPIPDLPSHIFGEPLRSTRASRFIRPTSMPMELTQRDEVIITRCFEDKLLSTSDLHKIFFGARARCVQRLKMLYANKYLDRYFFGHFLPYGGGSPQAMYTVGRRGISVVALRLGLDKGYVQRVQRKLVSQMSSEAFLLTFRHMRMVAQVRMAIEKGFKSHPDMELCRWVAERLLELPYTVVREGEKRRHKLRPDGFFQYRLKSTGKVYSVFVEADMGTMSGKQIQAKVQRYLEWLNTSLPLERFGSRLYRVLFVTRGERRSQELKEMIERLSKKIFWLTELEKLQQSHWLEHPIFLRAGADKRLPFSGNSSVN